MAQFTQREFLGLDDLLHEEEKEIAKYESFAQQCQDPELQQLCRSIAQRHQQHFQTLVRHLQQGHQHTQVSQPGWTATGQQQPQWGSGQTQQWEGTQQVQHWGSPQPAGPGQTQQPGQGGQFGQAGQPWATQQQRHH